MKVKTLLGIFALIVATALPTLGAAQAGRHPGKTVIVHPNGRRTVYLRRPSRRRAFVVRHRPHARRRGRAIVVHPRHR